MASGDPEQLRADLAAAIGRFAESHLGSDARAIREIRASMGKSLDKAFRVRHVDATSSEAEFDTFEEAVADMNDRNARATAMGLKARYVAEPTPPSEPPGEERPSDYESLFDKGRPQYMVEPAEKITLTQVANAPVLLRTTFGIPDRPVMAYPVRFSFSFGEGSGFLLWDGDEGPAVGMSTNAEWDLPELVWNANCRAASSHGSRISDEDGRVRLVALVESVQTENDEQLQIVVRLGGNMIVGFLSGYRPKPGDWLEIEPESLELSPQ